MKLLIVSLLSGITALHISDRFGGIEEPVLTNTCSAAVSTINFQQEDPGSNKMSAAIFRAQDYCRAEPEQDFPFDVQFKVVSANIYFSGTNFKYVEKGTITNNSLKPVKDKMARCAAGSIVVFDEVKVLGPDKEVRSIAGLTLMLF